MTHPNYKVTGQFNLTRKKEKDMGEHKESLLQHSFLITK